MTLKKIAIDLNKKELIFNKVGSLNNAKIHEIRSITLKVFNYNETLVEKFEIDKKGNLEILRKGNVLRYNKEDETNEIFKMLAILDLENIVNSKKSFWLISHAPCYCFEINYRKEDKLEYCRQSFNPYFERVLSRIRKLK